MCTNWCAMWLMASACLWTSCLACWSAVLCSECRITSSRYDSTVPLCTRTIWWGEWSDICTHILLSKPWSCVFLNHATVITKFSFCSFFWSTCIYIFCVLAIIIIYKVTFHVHTFVYTYGIYIYVGTCRCTYAWINNDGTCIYKNVGCGLCMQVPCMYILICVPV